MILLPIVERELRVAARRTASYLGRLLNASVALALCIGIFLFLLVDHGEVAGDSLFHGLSWYLLTFALLGGPRATADCLSQEKREGTLGLLFLTDLKGHDVVLGKLVATSLSSLYGLLASLPVLAIPILLGGVSAGLFWGTALVLLNALFFSLTAGLLVSVLTRQERHAMGGTTLLVAGATIGLPILGVCTSNLTGTPGLESIITYLSPAAALAMFQANRVNPLLFWISVGSTHAMSWGFLGLACWLAPRTWQEKPRSTPRPTWGDRLRRWAAGKPATLVAFRRVMLARNPLLWLHSRARHQRSYPWIFLVAMLLLWIPGALADWRMLVEIVGLAGPYVAHWFFKYWVAIEAGGAFARDKHQGALELLLSTPLSERELVRGQWLALRHRFGAPLAVLATIELMLLVFAGVVSGSLWYSPSDSLAYARWAAVLLASLAVSALDLWAVAWTAMYLSVKSKTSHHATARAVNWVLLLPWLGAFGVGIWFSDQHFALAFAIAWVALSVQVDLFFGLRSQYLLQRNLRRIVAEQWATRADPKSWWSRRQPSG